MNWEIAPPCTMNRCSLQRGRVVRLRGLCTTTTTTTEWTSSGGNKLLLTVDGGRCEGVPQCHSALSIMHTLIFSSQGVVKREGCDDPGVCLIGEGTSHTGRYEVNHYCLQEQRRLFTG